VNVIAGAIRAIRSPQYAVDVSRDIGRRAWRRVMEPPLVNLIDVGAFYGLPSPWAENRHRIRHVLAFEPREGTEQRGMVTAIGAALWSQPEERDFYVAGDGSSLYKANTAYVREQFETLRHLGPRELAETWHERAVIERVERVHCRTLDDVLDELRPAEPFHFIKVDAQGAELPILRGGERWLREHCLGLQLELFDVPLYEGIALRPEVIAYLAALDFDVVKVYPPHGTFDCVRDHVFLRRGAKGPIARAVRTVYGLHRDRPEQREGITARDSASGT
jgi:FkbM family methyltransferase